MNYDELYDVLTEQIDPLLSFIETLSHEQALICAAYSILSIARLFRLIEGLGVIERAKGLLIMPEPEQIDNSLSFIS